MISVSSLNLHKIWWLWLPVIFLAFQFVLELTLPPAILAPLHSENGPHELLQFAVISAAFAAALVALAQIRLRAGKWLAGWVALAAVCCLYVAGEEISWGQHFLDWTTPEFWAAVNDQHETNLHNTSSWLDQKPRLLLEIGVITGGILLPLLQKYRPALVPARFAVIYPPPYLMPVALIGIGVKLASDIAELCDVTLFERDSEVEELYLFYFVLLYLLALRRRLLPT